VVVGGPNVQSLSGEMKSRLPQTLNKGKGENCGEGFSLQ